MTNDATVSRLSNEERTHICIKSASDYVNNTLLKTPFVLPNGLLRRKVSSSISSAHGIEASV